ncbi:MAG TPA: hypothetical protein VL096_16135 [Pirellulaceae bacterium]|nr:hypothetical protein [Pirellulaceae bacterium]
MSSVSKKPVEATPQPDSSKLVVRIVLFALLGYMIFAYAYDRAYLVPKHEETFGAVQKLIEKETSRSATDREEKGATSNKEVMEVIGFAPSVPLHVGEEGHYLHEKYTFRRPTLFQTYDIDVFYKGTKEKPELHTVSHTAEEYVESKPHGPVVPGKVEPTEEGKEESTKSEGPMTEEPKTEAPKTEEPKVEEPKKEEPKSEEPKTEEPKKEEPKVEAPKTEEPEVDAPKTEEPKTEEKAPE